MEMIMGIGEEELRSVYDVDDDGFMRIGMHGMVVETEERVVLIDPGCASFLPGRMLEEYGLEMEHAVPDAVRRSGYPPEEITDVLFTHLHFDHGSGAFERRPGGIFKAFPNARYVVSKQQMNYVMHPQEKEKGSFFNKLLKFAGETGSLETWEAEGFSFIESSGHTPHMQIPFIRSGDEVVVFISDLSPMKVFGGIPGGVGGKPLYSYYDIDPDLIARERETLMRSLPEGTRIVYYHEPGEDCVVQL
jgi:glyoxylase-like metal-dependent hydrolase (beta-lactamase superfamily II)